MTKKTQKLRVIIIFQIFVQDWLAWDYFAFGDQYINPFKILWKIMMSFYRCQKVISHLAINDSVNKPTSEYISNSVFYVHLNMELEPQVVCRTNFVRQESYLKQKYSHSGNSLAL